MYGIKFPYIKSFINNYIYFSDIAVGAPYENRKGAIYIYHGSSKGLKREFSQRILAKDIEDSRPGLDLSGFGISITSGLDIDDNSFNGNCFYSFV